MKIGCPPFVGLAILSALAFAARSIVVKAAPANASVGCVMLLQGAFSLPMLGLTARWRGTRLRPDPGLARAYAGRVLWGLGQMSLLLYAIGSMPIALASTLAYTAPLFVAALAPVLLRERSSVGGSVLAAIGFCGVAVGALPHLNEVPLATLVSGLGTGFCGAMTQADSRRLAAAGDAASRGVCLVQFASVLARLGMCVTTGRFGLSWRAAAVCFCGACLSAIAQLASASAYRYGNALAVSTLSLLTLPLTLVMAVAFLHVALSRCERLGMFVTLCACLVLARSTARRVRGAGLSVRVRPHPV